ncbi:MAG: uncharacterized protein JWP91_2557 [Fibrobacteres bacterium]|nr:uncharacterized protein [Fibrobacterota bacterium]
MKIISKVPAIILALSMCAMAQYKGGAVANGGSISGTVKVKGKPPADEEKIVHKNEATCGAKMAAQKYVVGAGGGVKWAVVRIDGIKEGKAMDAAPLFYDNLGCRFEPHVMVAPAGATLKVRNEDDMLHNSHFFLVEGAAKKNLINMALPKKGQVIENAKILRKEGLVAVQCDAHDFMQGYIWVLSNPYGAVSGDNGEFSLSDVPAGVHKLKIWHEGFGEKEVTVTVAAGKDSKVAVEF